VSAAAALTPADFEITALPGLSSPPAFKMYAGLLPIGDAAGTSLFFWFVESARAPAKDPLVFWTNGGPGSSSLAYGFWTEHGPFRLEANATGGINPVEYGYSWNRVANVLYVEMPSGVGFSTSEDTSHYKSVTDEQAASDTHDFLVKFLDTFSAFSTNDLYITGESYGGHYVPMIAKAILDRGVLMPHMKGFLIGNPGINSDWYYNVNEFAFVTFMWSHGLIPAPAYANAKDACNWDSFLTNCSQDATHPSVACRTATRAATRYIPSPLDPYDVLAPTCGHDGADAAVMADSAFLRRLRATHGANSTPVYDPCLSQLTPTYMNRKDVLAAVHVPEPPRRWPTHPPGWSYAQGSDGEKKDIALLFPDFFDRAPDWRIAVVSGTADSAVPFMGTERWMECLGQPVTDDWKAWKLEHDVAGMVKRWAPALSLVTVKGCGHTIPYSCPEAGFAFLDNFLSEAGGAKGTSDALKQ